MTPAINYAKKEKKKFSLHEYDHDPKCESYGDEAAIKLGIDSGRVYKTLVVSLGKELAVAIIPVSQMLDLKLFAKAVKTKKVAMADKKLVERSTGYVLGGVSPIGQKKKLRTVIDISAKDFETVYVSAGKRGLEIELSPLDLLELTSGIFEKIRK